MTTEAIDTGPIEGGGDVHPPVPPRARRFPWTSPVGLLLRGVMLALPFLALHLAGAREATTIVSGTSSDGSPPTPLQAGVAAAYMIAWFGAILGGPILAGAGALLAGIDALRGIRDRR